MEVAQATWNSQLDDLQSMQRSKYQEFILELYAIYKRQQLHPPHKDIPNGNANGIAALDGKEMVAEAMRTIGARQSNVDRTPSDRAQQSLNSSSNNKDLPAVLPTAESQPDTPGAEEEAPQLPPETVPEISATDAPQETIAVDSSPPPPPKSEDPELEQMIKSILEMGFDIEQAKGALLISNRDMVCTYRTFIICQGQGILHDMNLMTMFHLSKFLLGPCHQPTFGTTR